MAAGLLASRAEYERRGRRIGRPSALVLLLDTLAVHRGHGYLEWLQGLAGQANGGTTCWNPDCPD